MSFSPSDLVDLASFLRAPQPAVRRGAVDAVLGVSCSPDGRTALCTLPAVSAALRGLLGDDDPHVVGGALASLVNLSSDPGVAASLLGGGGVVSSVLTVLRSPAPGLVGCKRSGVMLLANLTVREEGGAQVAEGAHAAGA